MYYIKFLMNVTTMKQVYHNAHYRSTNFRDASLSFKSRQQHCHPPIYVQFTLQQSNKYTIMAITGQPSGATGWIRTSGLKDLQSFALGLSATVARYMVGVAGFEPAASCSQSRPSDRTDIHPEFFTSCSSTSALRPALYNAQEDKILSSCQA